MKIPGRRNTTASRAPRAPPGGRLDRSSSSPDFGLKGSWVEVGEKKVSVLSVRDERRLERRGHRVDVEVEDDFDKKSDAPEKKGLPSRLRPACVVGFAHGASRRLYCSRRGTAAEEATMEASGGVAEKNEDDGEKKKTACACSLSRLSLLSSPPLALPL